MGAAVLSVLVPGLAHLLLGKPFRGLAFLIFTVIGYICGGLPGIVIHVWCVISAAKLSAAAESRKLEEAIRRANK